MKRRCPNLRPDEETEGHFLQCTKNDDVHVCQFDEMSTYPVTSVSYRVARAKRKCWVAECWLKAEDNGVCRRHGQRLSTR